MADLGCFDNPSNIYIDSNQDVLSTSEINITISFNSDKFNM